MIGVAIHGPSGGQRLKVEQQAFVDLAEAVGGTRTFVVTSDEPVGVDRVLDISTRIFVGGAEPATVGVEVVSSVDAFLADEVEVPRLVALDRNTSISTRWGFVVGFSFVRGDIVRRPQLVVGPGVHAQDFTFRSDEITIVINPASVAHKNLEGTASEDILQGRQRAIPEHVIVSIGDSVGPEFSHRIANDALVHGTIPKIIESAGVFYVAQASVHISYPRVRSRRLEIWIVILGEEFADVERHHRDNALGVLIPGASAKPGADVMERRHLVERPAREVEADVARDGDVGVRVVDEVAG